MQENINKIMHSVPDITTRWDKTMFCTTPLYKSKQRHIPLYINQELFYKLFEIKEEISFLKMAKLLEEVFSTTIEPEAALGEPIGTAYIDYQADPLDLSLSGNLGSGRAYYIGKYFNIKGEKTPLAISTKKQYSDGYLEIERAIWEAVISNSLQTSISTGLNKVLAIFNLQELCEVSWRDEPVKRGKIIRVDEAGELDRTTHYFYTRKPLRQKELEYCAKSYGVLEADKFMERITHGNWSPGNISVKGHLIDFDTVGAVKGRGPCYSSTRWHHENRFGFEHMGQLKVLEALTADKEINHDSANFLELSEQLEKARQRQIAHKFIEFMGFDKIEALYTKYKSEIDKISALFIELSQKNYFQSGKSSTRDLHASLLHVYDFSALFRVYPTMKKQGKFNEKDALAILINSNLLGNRFPEIKEELSDIAQEHLDKVYEVIDDCFVKSTIQLNMLNIAALHFIKEYDLLFEQIIAEQNIDINDVEERAYIINEDRIYLLPYFTISYDIAMSVSSQSTECTQQKIETLIKANKRVTNKNHITDIRLYDKGYTYKVLNGKGQFQLCFSTFTKEGQKQNWFKEAVKLSFDDKEYSMSLQKLFGETILMSDLIDMNDILTNYNRETSLQNKRIMIYTHKEHIGLS